MDKESVHRMFGLPNDGFRVNYEVNQEATDFIIAEYGLVGGTTDITSWCKIIKDMNGASDDKFLRAWLIVAISTFLCPTTSLSASPRCYPAVMNLANVPKTNWCRFVVDQINAAMKGNRNSIWAAYII